MPELKRFDGIVIYLMFNDIKHHNKPHVHVFYGEFRASVAIDGTILAGELPAKQLKLKPAEILILTTMAV